MTQRIAIAFFTCLLPAAAQITNVSVQGVTATQAILSYTAPDNVVCTAEVSESASFALLVHDVDAALFPGSNLDNRAESMSSGRERVFVVGKRRAEKAANGTWYSRALQAYTPHYDRITCGGAQPPSVSRPPISHWGTRTTSPCHLIQPSRGARSSPRPAATRTRSSPSGTIPTRPRDKRQ